MMYISESYQKQIHIYFLHIFIFFSLQIHDNPCFFQSANSKTIVIIRKGVPTEISDGDKFGLIPDKFWYRTKIIMEPNNVFEDGDIHHPLANQDNLHCNEALNDNCPFSSREANSNEEINIEDATYDRTHNDVKAAIETNYNLDSENATNDLNREVKESNIHDVPSQNEHTAERPTEQEQSSPKLTEYEQSSPKLTEHEQSSQKSEMIIKNEPIDEIPNANVDHLHNANFDNEESLSNSSVKIELLGNSNNGSEQCLKRSIKEELSDSDSEPIESSAIKQEGNSDDVPGTSGHQSNIASPKDKEDSSKNKRKYRDRCIYADKCYR